MNMLNYLNRMNYGNLSIWCKKINNCISSKIISTVFFVLFFLFFSPIMANAAIITSTTVGGDWGIASTWVGSIIPVKTDNVVINGDVNINTGNLINPVEINIVNVTSIGKLFGNPLKIKELLNNGEIQNKIFVENKIENNGVMIEIVSTIGVDNHIIEIIGTNEIDVKFEDGFDNIILVGGDNINNIFLSDLSKTIIFQNQKSLWEVNEIVGTPGYLTINNLNKLKIKNLERVTLYAFNTEVVFSGGGEIGSGLKIKRLILKNGSYECRGEYVLAKYITTDYVKIESGAILTKHVSNSNCNFVSSVENMGVISGANLTVEKNFINFGTIEESSVEVKEDFINKGNVNSGIFNLKNLINLGVIDLDYYSSIYIYGNIDNDADALDFFVYNFYFFANSDGSPKKVRGDLSGYIKLQEDIIFSEDTKKINVRIFKNGYQYAFLSDFVTLYELKDFLSLEGGVFSLEQINNVNIPNSDIIIDNNDISYFDETNTARQIDIRENVVIANDDAVINAEKFRISSTSNDSKIGRNAIFNTEIINEGIMNHYSSSWNTMYFKNHFQNIGTISSSLYVKFRFPDDVNIYEYKKPGEEYIYEKTITPAFSFNSYLNDTETPQIFYYRLKGNTDWIEVKLNYPLEFEEIETPITFSFSTLNDLLVGEGQSLTIIANEVFESDTVFNLKTNFGTGNQVIPTNITILEGQDSWIGNVTVSEAQDLVVIEVEDQGGGVLSDSNYFNVLSILTASLSNLVDTVVDETQSVTLTANRNVIADTVIDLTASAGTVSPATVTILAGTDSVTVDVSFSEVGAVVTLEAENYDISNEFEVLSILTVSLSDLNDAGVNENQSVTLTANRNVVVDTVIDLTASVGTVSPATVTILAGTDSVIADVSFLEVAPVVTLEAENYDISNEFEVLSELNVIFSNLDEIVEEEEQEVSITLNRILNEDIVINLITNFPNGDKIIPEFITINAGEDTWTGNISIIEHMNGVVIRAEDYGGYYLGESNSFNVLEGVIVEKGDLTVQMFIDPKFRDKRYEPEEYTINIYSDENLVNLIYTAEQPANLTGNRRKNFNDFDSLEVGNYYVIGEVLLRHKTDFNDTKILISNSKNVIINVSERTIVKLKLLEGSTSCNLQGKTPILLVSGILGENQLGFNQIKRYFINQGYKEGCNLEVVDYERQDGILDIRNERLIPAINAAKERTGKDEVNVVAYPFGALVTLSYIYSSNYQYDIRNFVLVAIFTGRLNDSGMCSMVHEAFGENHGARPLVNYMCRKNIPDWMDGWFPGIFGNNHLTFEELQSLITQPVGDKTNLIIQINQSPTLLFSSILE